MSQSANDDSNAADPQWLRARNQLFHMIKNGRSFSGRERNCGFLNLGNNNPDRTVAFATVSALTGLDFPDDGRCMATSDWDDDGDLDLWISNRSAPRLRLMRNDLQSDNHFLRFSLEGNGHTTSRDAIAARVYVTVESKAGAADLLVGTVRAGEGFLSQSSKRVHFGIGDATRIIQLEVDWPGGDRERFAVDTLHVDATYRLVQHSGTPMRLEPQSPAMPLRPSVQTIPPPTQAARIPLITRVPMPTLRYHTVANGESIVVSQSFAPTPSNARAASPPSSGPKPDKHATLINLWATWCQPCLVELADLQQHRTDLQRAGVHVISISVDQLGERRTSISAVQQRLRQLKYGLPWGWVDATQMEQIQDLNDQFFFPVTPLPLPTSFLVDASGQLMVIYRGPTTARQVIDDLALATARGVDVVKAAAQLPGTVVAAQRTDEVRRRTDLQTRYRVAAWVEKIGQYDDAINHFSQLAAIDPTHALAHRHLAKLHLSINDLARAERYALRTIQLDASNAGAHNTLGLIRSKQGNAIEAESYLRQAIKLDGQYSEAYNNLGSVLASQGKLAAAQTQFQMAVDLDDQFAEALTNLGSVFLAKNQANKAAEMYQRAIQVDSDYVDAYNNLGTLMARGGKMKEAIQFYREVLKRQPGNRAATQNMQRAQDRLRTSNVP